jgi:hypothetical protein
VYYFGYCTWLDEPELRRYQPEAKLVTRAVARNHKVEFRAAGSRTDRGWCHLSNVGDAYGAETVGLVYECDDARLQDDFDDFEIIYLTVMGDDGKFYDCFTYVLSQPGALMRPPKFYWNHIPVGMRKWTFPDSYINQVESTYGNAAECPDADRPPPSAIPGRAAATR